MSSSVFANHVRALAIQVKEAADAGDSVAFSPRTTSLSVVRAQTQQDAAEERFFRKLDEEVWLLRLYSRALSVRSQQTQAVTRRRVVLAGN